MRPTLLIALGFLAASTTGHGRTPTRIDPRFGLVQKHLERFGPKAPLFGPQGLPAGVDRSGTRAILHFGAPLTSVEVAALRGLGVELDATRHVGAFYPAFVPFAALPALDRFPGLVRAESTWRPRTLLPLEVTTRDLGVAELHAHPEGAVDGTGVLMATIDSGVDVFHPHLFHADGGAFDWLDANGNGRFDTNADAVDLNRNGSADPGETLRLLEGADYRFDGFDELITRQDGGFQASRDWLYADSDGNNRRDFGSAAGFTENTPGYGEPMFVAPNPDGNDRLDLGEPLVRLGTSKLRLMRYGDRSYRRGGPPGQGLVDTGTEPAFQLSDHGTGVASILLGGQRGFHGRVGLAPAAELLSFSGYGDEGELVLPDRVRRVGGYEAEFLTDIVQARARLALHEWTEPFFSPQDGGTSLEAMMTEARDREGVIQVTPVGNLNDAEKTMIVPTNAGNTVDMRLVVGPGFTDGFNDYPFFGFYGSVSWRGDYDMQVQFDTPEFRGATVPPWDGTPTRMQTLQETYVSAVKEVTLKGHHVISFAITRDRVDRSLEQGVWIVRLIGFPADDAVYGRVSDYYSAWSPGVGWERFTSDVGTVTFPATADGAFGVAAYGGRHDDYGPVGDLRSYSGRGPRMDGERVVDIAAPDDPFAALAYVDYVREAGFGQSWFFTFGGTSGAGPHVAGTIALLAQRHPEWDANQLENRILDTALREGLRPGFGDPPNTFWGEGKLNPRAAVVPFSDLEPRPEAGPVDRGVGPPPRDGGPPPRRDRGVDPAPDAGPAADAEVVGAPPVAALRLRFEGADMVMDASQSVDPEGESLRFRFDADEDGTFETDWQDGAEARVRLADLGPGDGVARVEVQDAAGHVASARAGYTIHVGDGGPAGGQDAGEPAEQGGGGGGCSFTGAPGGGWAVLGLLAVWLRRTRQAREPAGTNGGGRG